MSLFLQIRAGTQGYLIEARYVTRVLPLMRIQSVPLAIGSITGTINYQGLPVPVADLCQILLQRPSVRRVSTRLVVLAVDAIPAAQSLCPRGLLALLAEGVNDVVRLAPSSFFPSGRTGSASCLGSMANVEGSLLQKIELAQLLGGEGISTPRMDSGSAA
jgi:chemotaxis-related protein WspB